MSAAGEALEAAAREPVASDDRKEVVLRTSCLAGGLQLPAARAAPRLRPRRQDEAMAAAAVAAPEVLRECGCKGIRTCLICERQRGGDPPWQHPPQVRAGGGAVPQVLSSYGETEAQTGYGDWPGIHPCRGPSRGKEGRCRMRRALWGVGLEWGRG